MGLHRLCPSSLVGLSRRGEGVPGERVSTAHQGLGEEASLVGLELSSVFMDRGATLGLGVGK